MKIEKANKILCFFAHPDDETIGMGATLAKFAELGVEFHVAIAAKGILARKNMQGREEGNAAVMRLRNDCLEAVKSLGVPASQVYFGEFPDNEMDKCSRLEVIQWLEEIAEKVKPDIIFTHHRYCSNIDHQYCYEAAMIAARPAVDKHISVVSVELPASTGYLRPVQWEPNFYVEISEEDLNKKIEATAAYKDEIRPDPHQRSIEAVRALAKVRGVESGFLFAEAFMIQRTFIP